MKTINNRAIEYCRSVFEGWENPDLIEMVREAYVRGAIEQNTIDVEKAYEWLQSANKGMKFLNSIGRTFDGVDAEMFRRDITVKETDE